MFRRRRKAAGDSQVRAEQAVATAPPGTAGPGKLRTDLNCTQCDRTFIAELDTDVAGNHVIECPYCGHEHCRVIEGGRVTDHRWSTRLQRVDVERRCVWKAAGGLQAKTSTASAFLRDRWLNRSDWQ